MKHKNPLHIGLIVVIAALVLLGTGCAEDRLAPQTSYQGRLTDENGYPLNGTVDLTIKLYHADSGGNAVHSETHSNVAVDDGLFDMAIGPTALGSLAPEDMTQPLWLEVTVDDGTYSEVLTPRQRLLGSPYAFTLMPGTVISGTMDTVMFGTMVDAVVTIRNNYAGDGDNPALPALRVAGEGGLEIANRPGGGEINYIHSDRNFIHSDLNVISGDEIWLYLDREDDSSSEFRIHNGSGAVIFRVTETGSLNSIGTKSAVVKVENESRRMYALESTEVWFEDFGSSSLQNGKAKIKVDPRFAGTVNLSEDYHVFLTPLGDCKGLYVTNKTGTGFEVHELGGGTSSVSFDYRIVAHRAGYEHLRMELDTVSADGQEVD
jgi:hypothetical protein